MKRKLLSICCAVALMAGMLSVATVESRAAEQRMIDGSYLTHEEESVGYDTKLTRGEDLMVGYSKCSKLGPGKVYAGGTTIAAQKVDEVGVFVIIERAKEEDEAWSYCDSWQRFLKDTDRVTANHTLLVEGGYYYRVRCTHSANSDVSSSFTNGIYIE